MRGTLPFALLTGISAGLVACASVPKGQYGVSDLAIEGTDALSERAISQCLLTVERDSFGLTLGFASSDCNAPPFDSSPPRLELWSWPWTDYPGLNHAILDTDKERIERFYKARGYYDARVVDIRFDPPEAGIISRRPGPDACQPDKEECTVSITFVVEEGEPIMVGDVEVQGLDKLAPEHRAMVEAANLPNEGERFDELHYDRGKKALANQLAEACYADGKVTGEVRLDHERKRADIIYRLEPGGKYRFGQVIVEGNENLPEAPIIAAAAIVRGELYRQSALAEVQAEIYALGAFSSVEVERRLRPEDHEVDLVIDVRPLPRHDLRLGIGVTAGALQRTLNAAVQSVPQWDIHTLARYELRHVFGLGKLRVEERPRLIQQQQFPQWDSPQLGNVIRLRLSQPGWLEARTMTSAETTWDYGPDPFQGFVRSDLFVRTSAERAFFHRHLFAGLALQFDRFIVHDNRSSQSAERTIDLAQQPPLDYYYSFVEQDLRLDLRDDEIRPRSGALLIWQATASVKNPASDWTMFRLLPDARAYLPLPFDSALALRFALGAIFITDTADSLEGDAAGKALGPYAYRLRGGGSQSNRGYLAGQLGVGLIGGVRRWEATAELRVRLGESFGAVLFYDMGNVRADTRFGFDQPNPSAGFGLRYLTVVGTIRLDLGFRLHEVNYDNAGIDAILADAGPNAEYTRRDPSTQWIIGSPGALHITIGEAF